MPGVIPAGGAIPPLCRVTRQMAGLAWCSAQARRRLGLPHPTWGMGILAGDRRGAKRSGPMDDEMMGAADELESIDVEGDEDLGDGMTDGHGHIIPPPGQH